MCSCEVLEGIERADKTRLKKAYRKLAIQVSALRLVTHTLLDSRFCPPPHKPTANTPPPLSLPLNGPPKPSSHIRN